jgi:hypothetical protein
MAHRIKPLAKLTLRDMMFDWERYAGLPDGLIQLPVPDYIRVSKRYLPVPKDMTEFCANITYGQRIFLTRTETNDFGHMIRLMDGYYYPMFINNSWDENKALQFGKYILTCKVEQLYPVTMHLTTLISECADRERTLLHRDPSKMELAAGIEKLNVFADLTALDFLRDAMKVTVPEVLLTPYNECLVRFMMAKESTDFQNRFFELEKEAAKPKSKYQNG